jgi:hypothetical protein
MIGAIAGGIGLGIATACFEPVRNFIGYTFHKDPYWWNNNGNNNNPNCDVSSGDGDWGSGTGTDTGEVGEQGKEKKTLPEAGGSSGGNSDKNEGKKPPTNLKNRRLNFYTQDQPRRHHKGTKQPVWSRRQQSLHQSRRHF